MFVGHFTSKWQFIYNTKTRHIFLWSLFLLYSFNFLLPSFPLMIASRFLKVYLSRDPKEEIDETRKIVSNKEAIFSLPKYFSIFSLNDIILLHYREKLCFFLCFSISVSFSLHEGSRKIRKPQPVPEYEKRRCK